MDSPPRAQPTGPLHSDASVDEHGGTTVPDARVRRGAAAMHPPRRVVPGPPSNRAPVRTLARSDPGRRWLALSSACTRTGPARAVDIEGPGRRGGPRYGRVSPQDRDGTVQFSARPRGAARCRVPGLAAAPATFAGRGRCGQRMYAARRCRRRCGCVVGQTRPRRRRSDRAPQRWLGRTRRAGGSSAPATLTLCGVAAEGGFVGIRRRTRAGREVPAEWDADPDRRVVLPFGERDTAAPSVPRPAPRTRDRGGIVTNRCRTPWQALVSGGGPPGVRCAVRCGGRPGVIRTWCPPRWMVSIDARGCHAVSGVPVRCCAVAWPPRR